MDPRVVFFRSRNHRREGQQKRQNLWWDAKFTVHRLPRLRRFSWMSLLDVLRLGQNIAESTLEKPRQWQGAANGAKYPRAFEERMPKVIIFQALIFRCKLVVSLQEGQSLWNDIILEVQIFSKTDLLEMVGQKRFKYVYSYQMVQTNVEKKDKQKQPDKPNFSHSNCVIKRER